jgi:hypothetical protein
LGIGLSKLNKVSNIETYSSRYRDVVDEDEAFDDLNELSEPERDFKLLILRILPRLAG